MKKWKSATRTGKEPEKGHQWLKFRRMSDAGSDRKSREEGGEIETEEINGELEGGTNTESADDKEYVASGCLRFNMTFFPFLVAKCILRGRDTEERTFSFDINLLPCL